MKIVKEHVQQFLVFKLLPPTSPPFGIQVKVNQSVSGVEKSETSISRRILELMTNKKNSRSVMGQQTYLT